MTSPCAAGKDNVAGHSAFPRREILKGLVGTLGISTFANGHAAIGQKSIWKVAVGLNGFQSGSRKYRKDYPIWEILDFASQHRFDGVELVADWPSGGYPAATETERIRALRRFYDLYGLQIFSIQLGADGAFDPSASVRGEWLQQFGDRVHLARELGCECVGMWPHGDLRGQTIDEAIEVLAATFREAGRIAGDAGLLACFEIEPVFVFNRAEHYLRILRDADHPALKGIYDPSHFDQLNGATGRPEELLARVGPQNIGYVQFCDTDSTLRDGGTSTHLGCGDGRTDCAKGLRILKEGGFRGWIMVDEWEVPDPYDACLKCKRVIDEVGTS
jgi:sugar phosphate isomerase/epimerase